MEISVKTKFELGQIVRIKGADGHKLLIGKIMVERCPGGVQILYHGILLLKKPEGLALKDDRCVWYAEREQGFNEILLESTE